MKFFLAVVLSLAIPIVALAGDNGYKVTYDGGSVPDVKSGTGVKLYIEANRIRFVKDNAISPSSPLRPSPKSATARTSTAESEPPLPWACSLSAWAH